jgi:hypothetical protein
MSPQSLAHPYALGVVVEAPAKVGDLWPPEG